MNLPFLIVPTEILNSIALQEDETLNRKIYSAVKETVSTSFIREFGFDSKMEAKQVLGLMEDFFTSAGWGGIKNIDIDNKKKRAIVVVTNAPTGSALMGKVKHPVDHMLRGILAGMFSNYYGEYIDCFEMECVAINNPNCKFILKKSKGFDFTQEEIQRQLKDIKQ